MKQVIGLSVALVAALVGTYVAWNDTSEPPDDATAVAVYDAGEDDVTKVVWEGREHSVTVERKTDAKGPYLWVTSIDRKYPKAKATGPHGEDEEGTPEDIEEPDPTDGAADAAKDAPADPAAPPAPPEPDPNVPVEEKTMSFMANSQGEDMFGTFAPLQAMRELPITAEDRSLFGLDEPSATVTVTRKKGPVELSVGGETYGSKDRYVDANGKVFLIDDGLLKPLEFASSRVVERSLFPTAEKDVVRVEVQAPGNAQPLTYVQQNPDDAAKSYWARAETPDTADEAGGTWLDKVFRLKLKDYADASAVTAPLELVVAYTVHGADDTTHVEILKTSGETPAWYARSDYNRSLVSLTESLVRNVVDDVPTLLTAP